MRQKRFSEFLKVNDVVESKLFKSYMTKTNLALIAKPVLGQLCMRNKRCFFFKLFCKANISS